MLHSSLIRAIRLPVLFLVVVALSGVQPAHAVTAREIEKARAERAELQRRLDTAVARYSAAEDRYTNTQEAIAVAEVRISQLSKELSEIQTKLSRRATFTYKQGRAGFIAVLLDAESPNEFLRRLVLLERAAGSDSAVLLRATRLRSGLEDQRAELVSRKAQEREAAVRMKELTSQLSREFEAARALEARLLSEREAQERARREAAARAARAAAVARRTTRGFSPGSFVCPMDGPHSFSDTWGAPRSGGRRHQGVDIYAARGTPVAAVVDGVVTRMTRSSLGGISLYLRGGDGSEYFYTHLAGYAPISQGQHVAAGTHVAYNGSSGNAGGGPPHLHFEIHPGGGAPINPYPTVRAACG